VIEHTHNMRMKGRSHERAKHPGYMEKPFAFERTETSSNRLLNHS
jgi:hypothetical protein